MRNNVVNLHFFITSNVRRYSQKKPEGRRARGRRKRRKNRLCCTNSSYEAVIIFERRIYAYFSRQLFHHHLPLHLHLFPFSQIVIGFSLAHSFFLALGKTFSRLRTIWDIFFPFCWCLCNTIIHSQRLDLAKCVFLCCTECTLSPFHWFRVYVFVRCSCTPIFFSVDIKVLFHGQTNSFH